MSWSSEFFALVNNGKKKNGEEDASPVRKPPATSPYSAVGRLDMLSPEDKVAWASAQMKKSINEK